MTALTNVDVIWLPITTTNKLLKDSFGVSGNKLMTKIRMLFLKFNLYKFKNYSIAKF